MSPEEITIFLAVSSASFPLCYYVLQACRDWWMAAPHRQTATAAATAPLVQETPTDAPESTPDTQPETKAPVLPNTRVDDISHK
jgi:hypothetical protein